MSSMPCVYAALCFVARDGVTESKSKNSGKTRPRWTELMDQLWSIELRVVK